MDSPSHRPSTSEPGRLSRGSPPALDAHIETASRIREESTADGAEIQALNWPRDRPRSLTAVGGRIGVPSKTGRQGGKVPSLSPLVRGEAAHGSLETDREFGGPTADRIDLTGARADP